MDPTVYLGLRALHVVGFVVWFAGLFYLGRLLVYHREASLRPPGPARKALVEQLGVMSERLWRAITVPGLVFTLVPGLWLLIAFMRGDSDWLRVNWWMHLKLGLVAMLIGYHLWCGHLVGRLRRGGLSWSSRQLRWFNEIPTLLLLGIVFSAVMKSDLSLWWLLGALAGLAAVIGAVVALLARRREAPSS